MHSSRAYRQERKVAGPVHALKRLCRWAAPRRRAAAGLMLRGTCYGLGTGSILALWIQNQL